MALKKIKTSLENLSARQTNIYNKFVEMHNSIGSKGHLSQMAEKLGNLEQQIGSITQNIDQEGLEKLIGKSEKLVEMFNRIAREDSTWKVGEPFCGFFGTQCLLSCF